MGPALHLAGPPEKAPQIAPAEQGFAPADPLIRLPEERALFLQLLALPDAMTAAEKGRAPNILCEFAFELAQQFSRFYAAFHILSETDAALKAARLGLCGLSGLP